MAVYIDKKQAIDRIASCYCMDCEHSNGILCRACEHQDDMDLIDDMPAADVQPIRRGRWLQHGKADDYLWCCSACKKWIIYSEHDLYKHHFCGNCGADMRDVPDTDVGEIANTIEFKKRMERESK